MVRAVLALAPCRARQRAHIAQTTTLALLASFFAKAPNGQNDLHTWHNLIRRPSSATFHTTTSQDVQTPLLCLYMYGVSLGARARESQTSLKEPHMTQHFVPSLPLRVPQCSGKFASSLTAGTDLFMLSMSSEELSS